MRLIGNIIWFLVGGLELGLAWWVAGVLMFVSIIGIPWGRSCFVIGVLAFWPFGREVVDRRSVTGRGDLGTGSLGCLGNIIWFLLGGLWLFLGHLGLAIVYFVTIIGIPFALQHLKLAQISLAPVGKSVVRG